MRYRAHIDVGNRPNKHWHCCSVQFTSPPLLRDDSAARTHSPEQPQIKGHIQHLADLAETANYTGRSARPEQERVDKRHY